MAGSPLVERLRHAAGDDSAMQLTSSMAMGLGAVTTQTLSTAGRDSSGATPAATAMATAMMRAMARAAPPGTALAPAAGGLPTASDDGLPPMPGAPGAACYRPQSVLDPMLVHSARRNRHGARIAAAAAAVASATGAHRAEPPPSSVLTWLLPTSGPASFADKPSALPPIDWNVVVPVDGRARLPPLSGPEATAERQTASAPAARAAVRQRRRSMAPSRWAATEDNGNERTAKRARRSAAARSDSGWVRELPPELGPGIDDDAHERTRVPGEPEPAAPPGDEEFMAAPGVLVDELSSAEGDSEVIHQASSASFWTAQMSSFECTDTTDDAADSSDPRPPMAPPLPPALRPWFAAPPFRSQRATASMAVSMAEPSFMPFLQLGRH